MRFSLHSVHGGVKDINEIYDRAQRAEALGFEGIFLGESLGTLLTRLNYSQRFSGL
jgi:alkanesulfonate monooxygenase SsuD/methylene tetrahydromethanopterin reductase-like flavin-dependent oxidoreductase (luciferase family)